MSDTFSLRDLKINQSAVIDTVGGTGHLRQHLLDMGIIPGARVQMIRLAPMGDPLEFRIHDYELTLRAEDAGRITVSLITEGAPEPETQRENISIEHPGLGEEGKYHVQ